MKAIIFTTMFWIISILTFGQNIPNIFGENKDLNQKVFEHVLIKQRMDSTEVKMGNLPFLLQ